MGKVKEHVEKKKCFVINDCGKDKVLGRIEEIKKLDNSKMWIDTNDKLPDQISLKYFVILVTCAIKDARKFYPELVSEEALYEK